MNMLHFVNKYSDSLGSWLPNPSEAFAVCSLLSFLLSSSLHHDHMGCLINTLSWWWCYSHGLFFLMWVLQVAFVMSHSLLMSLYSFKLGINWNETTGLVRLINLFRLYSKYFSFFPGKKKTVVICPEMGENNAFQMVRLFVLRSGFIGMINLACTICSPVCPQGNYHSL